MNLLFSINRNFVPLLCQCCRSILARGGMDCYSAYVLHSDLTEADQETIRRALGEKMDFHFLPVPQELFEGFPETDRYPKQIYYRLAAPLLLPRELERILYLDVDILVINSLSELEREPFEGASFMACTHVGKPLSKLNQARLGVELKRDVPYLNSGVLLFDLPAFRAHLDMDEIREYANRKKYALFLPDQDILTALYGDHVKLLDALRYNLSDRLLTLHNLEPQAEQLDLDWVRKNAVILHFCGKNKPWREGYQGILDTFYYELSEPEPPGGLQDA